MPGDSLAFTQAAEITMSDPIPGAPVNPACDY
jgi:hypothetical protein